jgi:hypothetical protein
LASSTADFHFHLVKHPRAVHLHRAHADVELVGNQLVGQALDHQPHHVTLALGQVGQPGLQPRGLAPGLQRARRLRNGLLDAVHQGVVGERFFAESRTRRA